MGSVTDTRSASNARKPATVKGIRSWRRRAGEANSLSVSGAWLAGFVAGVEAHEVRPGYLAVRQTGAESFDVLWKVPAKGTMRLGLHARLPETCRDLVPRSSYFGGGASTERWSVTCLGGLTGKTIAIDGLRGTLTDVLVRIERTDGTTQVTRLSPAEPSFVVEAVPSAM